MDSGSDVPTLSPGLSETVAAKVLTVARDRWGAADGANLADSWRATTAGVAPTESMLMRKAFFLALDNAGRRSAAITPMMMITTKSSMRVKARTRIFIHHLLSFLHGNY